MHSRTTWDIFFDHIYISNLSHRTDRWKSLTQRLPMCCKEKQLYTRVEATNGNQHPWLRQWHTLLKYRKTRLPTPGSYGYLWTMTRILQHAIQQKWNNILIFDDDVWFHREWEKKWEEACPNFPLNWQLLYLGASHHRDWHKIKIQEGGYHPLGYVDGSFAIGLSSSIFPFLLREIQKWKEPFDSGPLKQVQRQFPSQCWVVYPNICIADLRESDIRSERGKAYALKRAQLCRWNLTDFS